MNRTIGDPSTKGRTVGGQRTSTTARDELQRRKQRKILKLFGTLDYDPQYEYKKQRRAR